MCSAAFIWQPGEYDTDHPAHQQAKRQYARWYEGYHIVVSKVLRSYGDGAFAHITPNGCAAA